jgi:hypothetical protein
MTTSAQDLVASRVSELNISLTVEQRETVVAIVDAAIVRVATSPSTWEYTLKAASEFQPTTTPPEEI